MFKNKILLTLPSIVVGSLIFFFSSFQKPIIELNQFALEDKLAHLLVFFVFGISLLLPLSHRILQGKDEKKAIFHIIIIGLFYAGIDEIHQAFVPGRVCDVTDWIADALGVTLAILFRIRILNLFFRK